MKARFLRIAIALLAAAVLNGAASAQAVRDEDAVESARKALAGRTRYPWYDRQSDQLRRIDVKPPREVSDNRRSTWVAAPPKKKARRPWFSWSWFGFGFWKVVKLVFWLILAAVSVVIVAQLIKAFRKRNARAAASAESSQTEDSGDDVGRVESLPFQIRRPRADLLAEAQRHYEQGDYDEAVIYLFSYELVQLDKRRLVRLAKGKTNRQYLREVSPLPQLFQILERTMVAFEDVFFGDHRLGRGRFESCWLSIDEFHVALEQASGD